MSNAPVSSRRKIISIVVPLLILAALIGGFWYAGRSAATEAKVGDCVAQTGENSIEVVDCDDSKSEFRVVGIEQDKTQVEAAVGLSVCEAYEDQGVVQTYWEGKQGEKGFVLCLAEAG